MADTAQPSAPRKDADPTTDDRAVFEMLTRTYLARDQTGKHELPAGVLPAASVLGPYRIVGVLGRGGMGVVYEAEEIEDGRRVALKVLSPERQRGVDRERLLREGRLAASLNHPHCVYVFGAWEIEDQLVIAMELMRETLADRVKRDGPMRPAAAVDAILQVISGLEAAAGAGILHRDVKPSNCFVDEQGRVKIGDFGISTSAQVSDETAQSTRTRIVGTPAYASPEQLRGARLDTRSDIYGVGATLYELVTGRVPFVRPDLMALLMAVANDPPTAPHSLAPAIPRGLSAVILRSVAKTPERRFASYAALASELKAYSSAVPAPATLGARTTASVIDHLVLVASLTLGWNIALAHGAQFRLDTAEIAWGGLATSFALRLVYFGVSESIWGCSPGKGLCGLRLATEKGEAPTSAQVALRTMLFVLAFDVLLVVPMAILGVERFIEVVYSSGWLQVVYRSEVRNGLAWAILFFGARRINGFAGLHERLSGTRVVERPSVRRIRDGEMERPIASTALALAGPYRIVHKSVVGMEDGWQAAIDPLLNRRVWIRSASADTPPVSATRRAVSRTTRLHWLAGRRASGDAWDAYSAAPGVPLVEACHAPQSWADVRSWLLALTHECLASTRDGTRPPLRVDRVRVVHGGGASLVDDPAADGDAAASRKTGEEVAPCAFLSKVANLALGGWDDGRCQPRVDRAEPLPASAASFLRRLAAPPPLAIDDVAAALEGLVVRPHTLTRRWRLLPIALCTIPPLLVGAQVFFLNVTRPQALAMIPEDVRVAAACLRALGGAQRGDPSLGGDMRQALEVILAGRYRHMLEDPRVFRRGSAWLGPVAEDAALRTRILRSYPTVDAAQLARAERIAASIVASGQRIPERASTLGIFSHVMRWVLMYFAGAGLIMSLLFRRTFLHLVGLEVVADGRPASRARLFVRATLLWSPVLVAAAIQLSRTTPGLVQDRVSLAALLVMVIGATVAIASPSRGVHDRLTGTWVVPR
jgi:eukaryotic-like serine/threonine-protein kinase